MISTLLTVTIEALTCGTCGIPFGLEAAHHAQMQRTGARFYCPNGHHISYAENEVATLKKQLAQKNSDMAWWQERAEARFRALVSAERRLRATRGVATKIKRRVGKGVCPCCNRTFRDLARHMEGQHPDFAEPSARRAP
jgi:hypothetical protein